jgi:hypothetical protein
LVQNVVWRWHEHEMMLGTCHKYGIKWIPIGQLCKKSINQKVKVWSNFDF